MVCPCARLYVPAIVPAMLSSLITITSHITDNVIYHLLSPAPFVVPPSRSGSE